MQETTKRPQSPIHEREKEALTMKILSLVKEARGRQRVPELKLISKKQLALKLQDQNRDTEAIYSTSEGSNQLLYSAATIMIEELGYSQQA